ncbi:MAG: DUF86 domain-containing protein [Methanobacterium sp.]|jgi:uncharacterized protein with HEPN domain
MLFLEASENLFSLRRKLIIFERLEIIGEAVKNIPQEIKDKYVEIPWKQIAGMRDILIHQYSSVKLERVWIVVKRDIPDLKGKIVNLKENIEE